MALLRAADELGAANGALTHLGEGRLTSLSGKSPVARYVRDNFGTVRDALLRGFNWNFAKSEKVTLTADPTMPPGTFAGMFPLPSDCLRVLVVEGAAESDWACESVEKVVNGAAQTVNVLSTELTAPSIRYTRLVAMVERWDPLFLEIFELKLAAKIAPMLGKSGEAATLDARGDAKMPSAKKVDARESARERIRPDVGYIAVRRT